MWWLKEILTWNPLQCYFTNEARTKLRLKLGEVKPDVLWFRYECCYVHSKFLELFCLMEFFRLLSIWNILFTTDFSSLSETKRIYQFLKHFMLWVIHHIMNNFYIRVIHAMLYIFGAWIDCTQILISVVSFPMNSFIWTERLWTITIRCNFEQSSSWMPVNFE